MNKKQRSGWRLNLAVIALGLMHIVMLPFARREVLRAVIIQMRGMERYEAAIKRKGGMHP